MAPTTSSLLKPRQGFAVKKVFCGTVAAKKLKTENVSSQQISGLGQYQKLISLISRAEGITESNAGADVV